MKNEQSEAFHLSNSPSLHFLLIACWLFSHHFNCDASPHHHARLLVIITSLQFSFYQERFFSWQLSATLSQLRTFSLSHFCFIFYFLTFPIVSWVLFIISFLLNVVIASVFNVVVFCMLLNIGFRRWWCRLRGGRHRCWRDGNRAIGWRYQALIGIMRDRHLAQEV